MSNPPHSAMRQGQPSRTALITCLMRSLHTKYDRSPLIDDTWADQLVSAEERRVFAAAMGRLPDENDEANLHALWQTMPVYAGVIIRTRYTEEKVQAAAARGVKQYVVIGAGLDSFGVRCPEFARDMHVFEVDHPASQQSKRDRLTNSNAVIPSTLHFVPADLSNEDLGIALARSEFRFDQPAIFSWLGVTVYLTREANLATLRSIGTFAAPGSELVFTYIEQRALDSTSPAMQRAKAFAAAIGEPWLSGFDSETLRQELLPLGLQRVEDLGGLELQDRYCAERTDGFAPGRAGRIAFARVVGPP